MIFIDDSPVPSHCDDSAGRVARLMKNCPSGESLARSVIPGRYFNWVRAAWDRPSPTIPKSVTWKGFSIFHPSENRSMSGRELARLQSFPDGFKFSGRHADWVAAIGNSVPPLMMRVIAGSLAERVFGMERLAKFRGRTYKDILDAAWSEHLAPRSPNAPTVISLFAGCGGSSLDYSMAGFRELLAVEWDAIAAETFQLNFPNVPIWQEDIHDLSVERCLELTGLKSGELDILDGSPPCQGFSMAGKREFSDARNQLYNEYVRLLKGLQPKAFVMENVSGMIKGKMKLIFADCTRKLKAAGYLVSCRLLDAQWFDVPQVRKRLIWIGVREDLGVTPSHPSPTITQPVSVAEALADLQIDVIGLTSPFTRTEYTLACRNDMHFNAWRSGERPSPTVTTNRSPVMLVRRGRHEPQTIEAWKAAERGKSLRRTRPNVGSFQSSKLDPNVPSLTQTAQHRHWRWDEARQLTDHECARLQSFPDAFRLMGKKAVIQQQIGNSVPPLFMRAIALYVHDLLV